MVQGRAGARRCWGSCVQRLIGGVVSLVTVRASRELQLLSAGRGRGLPYHAMPIGAVRGGGERLRPGGFLVRVQPHHHHHHHHLYCGSARPSIFHCGVVVLDRHLPTILPDAATHCFAGSRTRETPVPKYTIVLAHAHAPHGPPAEHKSHRGPILPFTVHQTVCPFASTSVPAALDNHCFSPRLLADSRAFCFCTRPLCSPSQATTALLLFNA